MNRTNKFTAETPQAADHHDFGCADKKGRAVGAEIKTFTVDVVASDSPNARRYHGTSLEIGHYFGFESRSTRAGGRFGSSSSDRYFPSEAKRTKAIAKYLASAKKRAVKAAA